LRLAYPRCIEAWKKPTLEILPQAARLSRNVVLSLASGVEVAEVDLLSSSPLMAVSAPWPGPQAELMPIRWLAETVPYWQRQAGRWAARFQTVFLSPRFDPLPPCREVQQAVAEWLHLCARLGLSCWLQTRGVILPVLWHALRELADCVRVTLAMSTMDVALSRALEPGAAPPELRWRQWERLRQLGVAVQVTLAPLVPGLTDTAENLEPLLAAMAVHGVSRATVGYLLLDPLAELGRHRRVKPSHWARPLEELYLSGQLRRWGPDRLARSLPYRERQRRYARVVSLASQFGIELRPNTLADPDFRPSLHSSEQLALAWPNCS